MKTSVCRIFLWKFMHEVKSIITFEFSDNYSGIQQNSTLQHGKCSKTQNARGAREIAFAAIFNLTTHLLYASLKRKTDNIPIILRCITTTERARAVGMLQQYVLITLPFCLGHRSLNAGVGNAWRPENDEFSLVYRKLRHLSAGDQDL